MTTTNPDRIKEYCDVVLDSIERIMLSREDTLPLLVSLHQFMKRNDPWGRWCRTCLDEVGQCDHTKEGEGG